MADPDRRHDPAAIETPASHAFPERRFPDGMQEPRASSDTTSARFARMWNEWDARLARGEAAKDILRAVKDEDLVEILAGESRSDRSYDRDILATELLNRLRSRSLAQHPRAAKVAATARAAHEVAQESQEAIHHAEGILKAAGEVRVGAAVSASADASLLATRAAFDAAKVQADALDETLAQSRVGTELAAEAADVADEGREITRELEARMRRLGRAKEGKAASRAAQGVQEAATQAADVSAEHDEGMRGEGGE